MHINSAWWLKWCVHGTGLWYGPRRHARGPFLKPISKVAGFENEVTAPELSRAANDEAWGSGLKPMPQSGVGLSE